MAGDLSNGGPGGTRPLRIRPHWWAVLAVSLSLLALVAATTSGRTGPNPHKDAAAASRGGHTTPVTTHAPGSTTTTVPDPTSTSRSVSPPAPATAVTTVTLPFAVGPTTQIVTRSSTTASSAPTTTTTPTTTAPNGSSVGAAPAQPAPTIITGDLQQPDDATNSYTFVGAGSMRVTATGPTSPTLSLTVVCPAGTQSAEGSTSVTVLLSDADGTCAVTLKEMVVQYDAVSYRLTIAPAGG